MHSSILSPSQNSIRSVFTTLGMAWREAWAKRASFWMGILIMVVNDVVWVLFWVLTMRSIDDINGWGFDQIILLQAVFMAGAGLSLGLLSNVRHIPELITTGGLDSFLSLPVSALPQIVVRRVSAVQSGSLVFGILLFAVLGHPTPARSLIFLIAALCSCVVITSFLIISGSLTFFLGRPEASESSFVALLMFANYPIDVFSGLIKLTLYVIVPVAFVSSFPAKIVDEFDATALAILIGVSVALMAGATLVFRLGLRRYTSGAGWTNA